MGCILKLGDCYMEWSSIFDRLTHPGLKRSEFEAWYRGGIRKGLRGSIAANVGESRSRRHLAPLQNSRRHSVE
jgi:hypothetical protein